MGRYIKTFFFLLGIACLSPGIFPEEEASGWGSQIRTIPETLRRPEMGESPRYPKDVVIGELGQGESPDAAFRFARELLSALMTGSKDIPALRGSSSNLSGSILEKLGSIKPRSFRLGGGRMEADGSVSFLVRFLGSEESIAGELYLVKAEEPNSETARWQLDDFILEEKRELSEIRDSYRYDFSPYERFY